VIGDMVELSEQKNWTKRLLWLHRFAVVVASLTVVLIVAGALVTSTKSGDAIPDWPTSYGALVPEKLVGGILYEWAHRAVAGIVALLVLALAVWLSASPFPRWLKVLGWLAFASVIAQAFLGGLRVLVVSNEKVQTSALHLFNAAHPDHLRVAFAVAHGALAQVVLGLTFAIALFTKPFERGGSLLTLTPSSPKGNPLFPIAAAITALIFAQLIFGAVMRHTDAGLVIPDFPTSFGKVFPNFGNLPFDPDNPQRMTYGEFAFKVAINFAHRLNGFLIALLVGVFFWLNTSGKQTRDLLRKLSVWMFSLVVVQIFLGGLVVWTGLSVPATVAHVTVGATMLGLSVLALCCTVASENIQRQTEKVVA